MTALNYNWEVDGSKHSLTLVQVRGTNGDAYLFGREANRKAVQVSDFYIATTQVTQALWLHVMGANPAVAPGPSRPVENVSWKHITEPGGFLERINSSEILAQLGNGDSQLQFRLPSETEWEYAARGGPSWQDEFIYSGSNDPDEVAWYGPRWARRDDLIMKLFGWPAGWRLVNRLRWRRPTRTHTVAKKAPNQLGVYDMSGNVWEWCQDICADDLNKVPGDGSPYLGAATSPWRLPSQLEPSLHCVVALWN